MRTGIALAALLLLAPACAWAQDPAYRAEVNPDGDSGLPMFAGLRGSMAFIDHAAIPVPSTPPTSLRTSFNTGGGGSVYIGARLPAGFRVELEGLYRYLPVRTVNVGNNAFDYFAGGYAHVGAPMVNLLFDLPVPDFPLRPFFGGGLGGAYVAANVKDSIGDNYLRSADWHFAYQFIGGAEFALSQSSRLTAMYRWMQVDDLKSRCGVSGAPSYSCNTRLNSQSIDLGLEMDM